MTEELEKVTSRREIISYSDVDIEISDHEGVSWKKDECVLFPEMTQIMEKDHKKKRPKKELPLRVWFC